jgi:predicted HTH transcriptional regulator
MAVDRLIDQQPRARNEILAAMMRELGFCEERGSGIDKAAFALEVYGLPAVHFINNPDSFRAILYSPRAYKAMENEERLRTAYQHTCLHYVMGQKVTNASLRVRLKLAEKQSQLVSALIRKAIEANLIKVANPGASPRYIHYVPYWA